LPFHGYSLAGVSRTRRILSDAADWADRERAVEPKRKSAFFSDEPFRTTAVPIMETGAISAT
jgi:hypothetical protein